MMKKTLWILVLALGLSLAGLPAPQADIVPVIDKVMARFVELEHFSGTVLLARAGRVLYAKAFGVADKDHGVPVTMNTRFELGSIAKLFTGVGFMRLVEKGLVGLEDPVVKHLPEFPFGDRIRIIHLLTHTSGLPNYSDHPDCRQAWWPRLRNINVFLRFIYDQKLLEKVPGRKFAYNTSGFLLLGAIIERKSGRSFRDYIRDEILEPCGMTETSIASLIDIVPNRATGYIKDDLGRFTPNSYWMFPFIAGAGIQSTAGDLLKFARALAEGKLLKPETLDRMAEPYLEKNWGIVWRLDEIDGRKIAYHGGEADGASAMFRRYLKDDATIIVLSNYHRAGRPVAAALQAVLFGKPYEMPRPTAPEFLVRYMADHNGALPEGESGGLLKDNGYKIASADELNGLGYGLLDAGEIDGAIQVFLLNTGLFPGDTNVFDSLAEAYLRKGDRESAVRYYRKALEIDPKLASAKAALARLLKDQRTDHTIPN